MENIVEIKKLSIVKDGKEILKDFDFSICENTFITIYGVGKTSIIEAILGNIEYKGEIKLNINKNDIFYLTDTDYNYKYVSTFFKKKTIDTKKLEELDKLFNVSKLYSKMFNHLSFGEKAKVLFVSMILSNKKLLVIDDIFYRVDSITREAMFKTLKKYRTDKKATIIVFSNTLEYTLYGTHIAIIKNKKLDIYNKVKMVLKNNLKDIKPPFIVDLSDKLKYYGLVDSPIYEMDKMVDHLWK